MFPAIEDIDPQTLAAITSARPKIFTQTICPLEDGIFFAAIDHDSNAFGVQRNYCLWFNKNLDIVDSIQYLYEDGPCIFTSVIRRRSHGKELLCEPLANARCLVEAQQEALKALKEAVICEESSI